MNNGCSPLGPQYDQCMTRFDRIEKKLDSKFDALSEQINSLWRNGPISKLNSQVSVLKAQMQDLEREAKDIRSEVRKMPPWIYLLIGGALVLGGEGVKLILSFFT